MSLINIKFKARGLYRNSFATPKPKLNLTQITLDFLASVQMHVKVVKNEGNVQREYKYTTYETRPTPLQAGVKEENTLN